MPLLLLLALLAAGAAVGIAKKPTSKADYIDFFLKQYEQQLKKKGYGTRQLTASDYSMISEMKNNLNKWELSELADNYEFVTKKGNVSADLANRVALINKKYPVKNNQTF